MYVGAIVRKVPGNTATPTASLSTEWGVYRPLKQESAGPPDRYTASVDGSQRRDLAAIISRRHGGIAGRTLQLN